MKSEFNIHAWNNHSPSCIVPPVWNILASCEQQYLDLAPYDLDGDTVRCRWADLSEVGLAHYRPGKSSRLQNLQFDSFELFRKAVYFVSFYI